MKKITELLKAIDNHGLAIFSNSVATHIFEKNEFNYASTIDLSEYLNNQNNYAIMIICSDSISYLSIVKRKMDFPDGTVAVTSYGISSICKYSFENLQIKTKKSIDHTQLIEPKNLRLIIKKIYTDINDDGKEKIVELIKKYIHLSGPTFESEGNELFADDAEHIGVRIFRSRKDPIVRPLFDINEDDMIYKDLYSSNNGELIEDSVGHVRYITEQGRWLDVVNVNRKAGEKALGVDLIYYLREYRSIVMLQYKRIKDKTGTYYASSDGNYNSEIERMARTRDLFNSPKRKDENLLHKDFRLSNCPYYFKICPESTSTKNGYVSGACINLDHWNSLMKSQQCQTRDGNKKLGYDNLHGRYLKSSEFIELSKRGLLGGYIESIEALSKLIIDLKNNQHIVIASIESPRTGYSDV